jgi:hypothetical protein
MLQNKTEYTSNNVVADRVSICMQHMQKQALNTSYCSGG